MSPRTSPPRWSCGPVELLPKPLRGVSGVALPTADTRVNRMSRMFEPEPMPGKRRVPLVRQPSVEPSQVEVAQFHSKAAARTGSEASSSAASSSAASSSAPPDRSRRKERRQPQKVASMRSALISVSSDPDPPCRPSRQRIGQEQVKTLDAQRKPEIPFKGYLSPRASHCAGAPQERHGAKASVFTRTRHVSRELEGRFC